MAPKLSAGVSVKGAIAYQDDADPNTFHYFPSAPRLTLEDNLEAFSVKYWGIGERYYAENHDTGEINSLVGATIAGQVIFDNTSAERDRLRKEIIDVYGIAKPRLSPIRLLNTSVVPVFAKQTLGVADDGEATFPQIAEVGSSIVYNIANGRGKFAQLFANVVAAGGEGAANPDFALSIEGDVDYVADPWKVIIKADLKQVWSFVREQFSASAQIGWFNLGGASYEKVVQDLQKNQIVTIKYIEGSPDNKNPGLQLFEQGKLLFEAVNQQISAGEGMFKLEPNPDPPPPPKGGGSILPWSFSVSGSYQSSYFKQEVHWERELEYSGRALRRSPSSIVLAVSCGPDTKRYFYDLSDPTSPCITKEKMDKMQGRLKAEKERQTVVVKAASKELSDDKISNQDFDRVMGYLQNNSLSEDVVSKSAAASSLRRGRSRVQRWSRLAEIDYPGILRRAL